MSKALSLLAPAVFLLLAGCAPDAPLATPSQTAESATPTPTPTPTVEPVVKPLLEELVISPDGLGPIPIGRAYTPRDPATDVLVWDETFCGFAEEPDVWGYEMADYANWQNTYTGDVKYEFLAEVGAAGTTESPILRITTFSLLIRTAEGLGRGSTMDELREVYGSELAVSPEGDYFPAVVRGQHGQLVFWFSYEDPGSVYMLQVLAGFDAPGWSFHLTGCV